MKIYQVWVDSGIYFDGKGTGYQFFPSKKEALRYVKRVHADIGEKIEADSFDLEIIEVDPTKESVIKNLNRVADW